MKRREPNRYLNVAISARTRLGVAAFAKGLGLTTKRLEALITAHHTATHDDTPYADCLDRGAVTLVRLVALPVSRPERWMNDELDYGESVCPPKLRRVLDSLPETDPRRVFSV
jgi:hypothetical protein